MHESTASDIAWPSIQGLIRESVLGANSPALAGLIVSDHLDWGDRLDVYRNNTVITLSTVLGEIFPVTRQLVGDAFFDAVAAAFVLAHPPSSPVLIEYGLSFPAFLRRHPAIDRVPYLPDVARAEWLMHESFHSADEPVLPAAALQELAGADPAALRFTMHKAVRLLRSDWPVCDILEAHLRPNAGPVDPRSGGQAILVTRPDWDVLMLPVRVADWAFMSALEAGQSLASAAEAGFAADPDFDIAAGLGALVSRGALAGAETDTSEKNGGGHAAQNDERALP